MRKYKALLESVNRVAGCYCDRGYTCRYCRLKVKPWHFDNSVNDSDAIDTDRQDQLAAVREELLESSQDDVGIDDA